MSIKTMFVASGGGLDKVSIGTTQPRKPGPQEIAVRVRASSLNYHDLGVVTGSMPVNETRIPMSDGAGEVIEVGSEVTEFKVGDHVVSTFFVNWPDGRPQTAGFSSVPGDGVDGYAREQVTMPATAFTLAPTGYSHAEAATLTTAGLTAWRALFEDGGLKPGATVLVQGTGGVSIFALQFAKAFGASVIATSSQDDKLEKLRELGADHVLNYRQVPEWGAKVLDITDGKGVDHVIDVGGPDTLLQSMQAARVGGHIALIGVLSGHEAKFPLGLALGKQLRMLGVLVGNRRQQEEMIRAINVVGLRPVIDRHFALDDLVKAFEYQASGAHFGKIVIDI